MGSDLLIILMKTLGGYFILVLMMKLMGKREIGQLSVFDLVILLSISDIMVIGIDNFRDSYWYAIVPIIALSVVQKLIAFISLRFPLIRSFFDGRETIIIANGKINIKAMRSQNYNFNDLLTQLRQNNVRSIKEVQYAILETTGNLSVFTFAENSDGFFPLPLVVSGHIEKEAISSLQLTREDIVETIKTKYNLSIKEVEYAYFQNGEIKIL